MTQTAAGVELKRTKNRAADGALTCEVARAEHVISETAKWTDVIKRAGIKGD